MAKTEESNLEKEVETYMSNKGVWQLARYQAQSSQNGLPDRLYLYHGYLLGLELKASKGTPTNLQLKKLDAINKNGGIGVIIKTIKELEELMEIIDDYGYPDPRISSFIVCDFECWRNIKDEEQKKSKN